ncbi:MAG TPA: NlpC/P60 family protein [Acidimicrobiales bacterium]|nr:NlpC/P60 family protein [Acidimicrobiales bacterium]
MRPAEGCLAAARTRGVVRLRGSFAGRTRLSLVALTATVLLCSAIVPAIAQTPATAGTIQTLKAKAAALASQIDAAYAELNVLDEAYDQAQTRLSELKASIGAQNRAILASQRQLAADNVRLRDVAIDAYVNGASSGFSVFLNGNQQQLPMQQAYLSAASGNLNEAVSDVQIDRHALRVHKQALVKAAAAEIASIHQIAKDLAQAKAVTASLENALSQVKGQLAQAVAAEEQAQAAAAEARAAAAAAAAQPPPPPPPPPPASPTPPVAGGGSGEVAVQAAESQLGVPYVWGGATPGVGFDCSGLTMWAWGQAGVSLAHGATDQYYEIAHVSMSDLQPGDLIFYGDAGYLYHVVMYVGSGPYGSDTVIQAEETGTNVMYSPIPPGAYGAGQP